MVVVDAPWLRGNSSGWYRGFSNKKILRTLAGAFFFIVTFKVLWSLSLQSYLPVASPSDFYLQRGVFETIPLSGFVNTGHPGKVKCDELRHDGEIQIQQSFHLDDDLLDVANTLKNHPMISYEGQDSKLTYEQMVEKCWARLSGSSVWLEKHQVYLAVTRVIFYVQGVKHWPVISFLRGQLYDENWNELKNRTIKYQGDEIRFPTVFNIPTPYENGGGFYGPEDPRIIIEEGVDEAEPVVVFNMLSDLKAAVRTMHIFRPFTNDSTVLTINGQQVRSMAEKNWAPFFYSPTTGYRKYPSKYVHFIHSFKPLRILKCHLLNGYCDWAYEQDVPDEFAEPHNDTHGRMSGGTNFVQVPLPSASGTIAYVGFPRTHIDVGCTNEAMYRPEMMVMTASSPSHFHLDFMSHSIDFGSAVLPPEAIADPCGEGRILIANSVSRWDRSARQDVMTIALTVDDSTVQALRIHGVLNYIQRLPYFMSSLKHELEHAGESLWDLRWSAVGNDVLACSVEAAQNYTIKTGAPFNGTDLREEAKHKKEEAQKKKEEEERKKIEAEEAERERVRLEEERVRKEEEDRIKAEAEKLNAEKEKKKMEAKEPEMDGLIIDEVVEDEETEETQR